MQLNRIVFSPAFRTSCRRFIEECMRKSKNHYENLENVSKRAINQRNNGTCTVVSTVSLLGVTRCFLWFSNKKKDDPVMLNVKLGKLAAARQEHQAAERYYHIAIAAVDDQYRNRKIERKEFLDAKTTIFDDLANLALRRGEYIKAEKLFKETMKILLQKGMEQTHNAMVEITIKLGSIYAITNRDDAARMGYEEAIKIQEEKLKAEPESDENTLVLLGLALESYGRLCMFKKQYKEAEPLFVRAETIATQVLGKDHPQRIVILNDIATVQIMRDNLKDAESTLKQAVEVGTVSNVPELPALYSNLGAIYLRTSQLNNAEKSCNIALEKATENNDKHAEKQAKFCLKKILEERQKGVIS